MAFNKNILLFFILLVFATITLSIKLQKNSNGNPCSGSIYRQPLYINQKLICVVVVSTPQKVQLGLSGRENLGENQGMLFVFPDKSKLTFWMKGMKFDIDMIWIDGDRIVDVTKSAKKPEPGSPDNQLQVYSPKVPANKVLEVNSGYFDNNNLELGDTISIQ